MKQAKIRAGRSVKRAPPVAPVDSSNAENYRLRVVDGVLLVEKLDGTVVVKVPKGGWEYMDGGTCVKCTNRGKPRGTPDFIPCC